jgi:drug/metabolite transporter (DMT)-like permease
MGLALHMMLSLFLYFTLIKRTIATCVNMATYIMPVTGLMLGALVLKEPLTVTVLGSLALILLGVLLVNRTWRPSGRTVRGTPQGMGELAHSQE